MRLVLAGGGHAHLVALARWARRPGLLRGLRPLLLSDSPVTVYSGAAPAVLAGGDPPGRSHIDLAGLCARAGVEFREARLCGLDPDARRLDLEDGGTIDFDRASLNVGGAQTDAPNDPAVTPIRPLRRALAVSTALRMRADGLAMTIGVVGAGVAGVETALALAEGLGPKGRVILVAGAEGIVPGAPAAARAILAEALDKARIVVAPRSATSVTNGRMRLDDGSERRMDHVFWITGSKPPTWLAGAGLYGGAGGFPAVDKHLRSVSHPHVFLSGDAAHLAAGAAAKAGVYAVRQGGVLARNLPAACEGAAFRTYRAQRLRLALIRVNGSEALAIYGPFAARGRWAMAWKRGVDGRFVARLNALAGARTEKNPEK